MHTTHRIMVLLAASNILFILGVLYRLRRLRKSVNEVKKNQKEMLSRYSLPMIEHKPKNTRSEKQSFIMREKWRKLKELENK